MKSQECNERIEQDTYLESFHSFEFAHENVSQNVFIRFDYSKFLNYQTHFFNPYEVSFNVVDERNEPKINLSHDRESSHFFHSV